MKYKYKYVLLVMYSNEPKREIYCDEFFIDSDRFRYIKKGMDDYQTEYMKNVDGIYAIKLKK